MPLITINEIKNQYRKRTQLAIEEHNAAMNNKKLYVLKNFPSAKEILSKFPKPEIVSEQFNNKFDKLLESASTTILPYPTIDTRALFEKYFREEKPFGKADKKHEFPDALALQSLIQWCEEKKKKCIVLSNDSDLTEFACTRLKFRTDYKDFLNKTLKQIIKERDDTVDFIYQKNKQYIETQLELWIRDKLDDTTLYLNHANWLEVHDIQIPMVIISLIGYQVTNTENSFIHAEVTANVQVSIDLTIDDESYSYVDTDDKGRYYPETTNLNVEQYFEIPISVKFFVVSKKEFDSKIEIEEFNEGKELELEYNPEY